MDRARAAFPIGPEPLKSGSRTGMIRVHEPEPRGDQVSSCHQSRSSWSQMPRLGGLVPPVIVAAVEIFQRRRDQFGGCRIVEGGELDGHEVAAHFLDMAATECPHAAIAAKQMVHAAGAELIVAERVGTGRETEGVGLDGDAPIARLGADRAVAPAGATRQIEIRLIADSTAMAASVIGFSAWQDSVDGAPEATTGLLPPRCQQRWRLAGRVERRCDLRPRSIEMRRSFWNRSSHRFSVELPSSE
jgi:hypothetical protein